MAKYKYTGNKTHSLPTTDEEGRRNQAKPGDIVELSESQYAAFKDKFVPADEPKAAAVQVTPDKK